MIYKKILMKKKHQKRIFYGNFTLSFTPFGACMLYDKFIIKNIINNIIKEKKYRSTRA
jgi:hypothetical protein